MSAMRSRGEVTWQWIMQAREQARVALAVPADLLTTEEAMWDLLLEGLRKVYPFCIQ